ncbi:MAG: gamma-glutamyltransferase family protein [Planctomycetes bacterium]|nr:gamma-glutamyltransferase family protein [Planctomycetota bacterium]
MERRTFLQALGGLGTSALVPATLSSVPAYAAAGGPPLRRGLLAQRNQNRSTVVAQRGMVCTAVPLASMAGLDVLQAGGNAIDAAIAANAMLSLVEPMSCGPGGDLFAILWSEKHQKLFGLNASGRAPYDWSLQQALDLGLKEIPVYSPLSWSVPGCVSGWAALHERFGKLSFARLLEPTIQQARAGFPLSPIVAAGWVSPKSPDRPGLKATYLPDGRPVSYGTISKNPGLASLFETLAQEGPQAFYQGEPAARMVKFSQAQGGRFSLRDFRDHKADWVEPVSTSYRGYDMWEIPPNGQGIAALQMLNLLEHFDIKSLSPNSAEHLHLFLEAKKLAFEDRAVYYADMDFAPVPLRELISKEYAAERVKLIDRNRAAQQVACGRLKGPSDTTYLTAADGEGNMISLIQSIFHGWGSGYVPDGLGFCLQNRGQLFALDASHLNKLEPHKRPFHTIIPAFVTKAGRPVFSFGVMGGDFQPQGHVQVLMNLLDFGMSPQQAGDQPRIEHTESSTPTGTKMTGCGTVGFEKNIPDDTKLKLAYLGHRIRPALGAFGGYQGIWRQDDPLRYYGGSDPRKDGCAMGY